MASKEGKIYYAFGEHYWVDSAIISNFQEKIIELIEEGDYVNDKKIIEVREENGKIYLITSYVPQNYIKSEIKTIVTKEKFKTAEYEVK